MPRIKSEFNRVRRFQRKLAVVAIGMNSINSNENTRRSGQVSTEKRKQVKVLNQPKQISIEEFGLCGIIFYDSLREIDIISYDAINNQFLIFLPETDKQNASIMVDRIKKNIRESINNKLSIGIAEFPIDGLTIDELVHSSMSDFRKTHYEKKKINNAN